jgi:hypothetical protein
MLHADAGTDGAFSIQNVPPGPYTLTAQLPFDMGVNDAIAGSFKVSRESMREQMLNRLPETASMQINVTGDGVSGLTLNARRGGRVTGRYVADTGVSRPLPTNLSIALRGSGPGNAAMHMTGVTAADFDLAGLSGPSRVDVEGIPDGWAVKAILLDGEEVTDAPFDLSGKTGTMRVVMTDRLTSLSGTVQSDRSRRDHNVIAFSDDPTKWTSPVTVRAHDQGRCRGTLPDSRPAAGRALLRRRVGLPRGWRRTGPSAARPAAFPRRVCDAGRWRTALDPA